MLLLVFLNILITLIAGVIWIHFRKSREKLANELHELCQKYEQERINSAQTASVSEERKNQLEKQEIDLLNLRNDCLELERKCASFETKKESLELQLIEHNKEVEERREKYASEFDLLARKILDEKTQKFDETSQKALRELLDPLKGEIKKYHQNIQAKYENYLQDRSALKQEILGITQTNTDLKNSAESLAKTLRGDAKARGKWGELVLEKVLESSGLKKGIEYTCQTTYRNKEGGRLQPDVTINLSNQKHIFIDSKVSLVHYDNYINALDETEKKESLKLLENSFLQRIKELSEKEYHDVRNVNTLDFVLLFTPIESALALVIESLETKHQMRLYEEAWTKGVIITSPITLMPILRTIDLCWKMEYQNKHAQKIGDEAGNLYDKFVGFLKKLEKVGDSIKKSHDLYEEARAALRTGKGNIINKTEKIRGLLKKGRTVPDEYFDDAEFLDTEEELSMTDKVEDCSLTEQSSAATHNI